VNEPLRVLHVDTERGWRGGERQVFWLARALARQGHRSIVAARADEPLAQRATEAGLPVVHCNPITEFDPIAALALRRIVRREQIDVVHAHTGHAVTLAALAVLGTTAKMILTRRVDFKLRPNPGTRWKYGRADAIIAISEAVAAALVDSGIPRSAIEIIPSGIDLDRQIPPASAETLESLGVPRDAPLAVMVAALVGHKDPVTFVRAIAAARRAVPSMHALLVGVGPLRPDVEAAIAETGVGDVLHLTGYRTDADNLLAAADVFVLSSKEEGLGTVLLDALSLGKPVAACAAGGIPEIIQDGISGLLVPPRDGSALGKAVAAILGDSDLRARLVEGGRRRVLDSSVERTAEKTVAVYRRVLTEMSS
jgi:L-malate glycosyltransferase